MSNARNLSKVEVDTNGDIEVGSLGNANDASALTTGTLGTARLPAGSVLQVSRFYDSTSTYVYATNTFVTIQGSGKTVTAVGNNSKYLYHYVLSAEADQGSAYNCFYKVWYNKNGGAYQDVISNRVYNGNAITDSQGTVQHVISVILEGVSSNAGDTFDFYLSYSSLVGGTEFNQQSLGGQPSGTTNTSIGYVMEIST